MEEPDAPVFVVDLRPASAAGGHAGEAPSARLAEPVAHVAIVDRQGGTAVHGIEPTADGRFLDALARLIRFADKRGRSVQSIAERYGTEYERRLLFERRLPVWALRWGARSDRG